MEVPPLIIEPTQIHLGPLYLGVNSISPRRQDRPGGKYWIIKILGYNSWQLFKYILPLLFCKENLGEASQSLELEKAELETELFW